MRARAGKEAPRRPTLATLARRAEAVARPLGALGLLGILSLAGPPFESTRLFFLFFLVPAACDLIRWLATRGEARVRADPPRSELRLPGPAERSPRAAAVRYNTSSALSLLNPYRLGEVSRQAAGNASALARCGGEPPVPAVRVQRAEYRLPFRGEWLVMNGGITPATSHSWEILSQRYAYDFVVAEGDGRRHVGDGTALEEYFAYGREILAAADGVVVATVDGVRDAPGVGTGWTDWRARHIAGNSVTIRHAPDEYTFSAHLVPGSLRVRPGDVVRRGEVIGSCGHSGNSTEPHLHFQLQDDPDFFRALGLPIRFSSLLIDDAPVESGYLKAGMRVRTATEPP